MTPRCSACGAAQGSADLPVCVRCGHRLSPPADEPAATPARTELARRYFTPAVRYRPSLLAFLVELGAPFLLPLAAYALSLTSSGEPAPSWQWLCWVVSGLAVVLCAAVAVLRRPARLQVVLDARGARASGRRYPWSDLLAAELVTAPRGGQPRQLVLVWRGGQTTVIRRELAATARLGSLPNLAAMLVELLAGEAANSPRA